MTPDATLSTPQQLVPRPASRDTRPARACTRAELAAVGPAAAVLYDVIEPNRMAPPGCTCTPWAHANQTVRSWFRDQTLVTSAKAACAQPALAPGLSCSPLAPTGVYPKRCPLDPTGAGGAGDFCICAEDGHEGICVPKPGIPEQLNLQLASSSAVTISFVTFGDASEGPPVAMISTDPAALNKIVEGVTHVYTSPAGDRSYQMHFVLLADLEARAKYYYKVKSGSPSGVWSDVEAFRAPYGPGITKIAIFGDMGAYSWNNMANLQHDCVETEAADVIVHMGDHCYNIGGYDDRRGDGYMNSYSKVLKNCPWFPTVGNHEFYDGDQLTRYLNQTYGVTMAGNTRAEGADGTSTATSPLGYMLSAGNHKAAGTHGTTPSNTSRFFSSDFGLIHFVGLDLNMYNNVDTCGESCRLAQLEWLKKDLAAANANRDNVPWIIAMSHFPLYCSNCPDMMTSLALDASWSAEACEFEGHAQNCTPKGFPPQDLPESVTKWTPSAMITDFEPIFLEYGVDIYSSGHIHDYEVTYPIKMNQPVQFNYTDPRATIHLVTGNGGPPSASAWPGGKKWSKAHTPLYSYTLLEATNYTHLSWKQVRNLDGSVVDTQTIVQSKHG
eukprot:CAMPEP_0206286198 /NCGR_PEP_ID=MMETSP0106_2-20121207/480_1 /ASSEMBLY_ACC=CAM_ASM_000206 /TAXON_ID=81532 /ORGANISM="Acanthoeca-like sp., Strain 10tr" /LENGTH=610 /DNA_ID=CAMNT_0053716719 /DNA_START=44 /DNA_END=1873 /DNA_ORIENTATION=-